VTFWIELDVECALERIAKRRRKNGVGDNEAFLRSVSQTFAQLADEFDFERLDGRLPIEDLALRAFAALVGPDRRRFAS
jgi:thymidylate kinase